MEGVPPLKQLPKLARRVVDGLQPIPYGERQGTLYTGRQFINDL